MDARSGRRWWYAAAAAALAIGALAAVQSIGYWALTAVQGEPASVLFIDHAGPAVTSFLIAIVMLGLGVAALAAARRRPRPR
ncbi:hypothetical protein P0L94_05370 [Microbacter sp. GSS18]|nr:hypothetical protein P0L94_05370 [Microbacter sp. GSS18]